VWDNGAGTATVFPPLTLARTDATIHVVNDLSVYGRYAAIEYASHDLIYVQDDDVIVSDPQAIVDSFIWTRDCAKHGMTRLQETPSGHFVWACDGEHDNPPTCVLDEVVCNMPPEFRPHYDDSALVGFGACFHRDAPGRAFDRYAKAVAEGWCPPHPSMWGKTSFPNPTQDESWLRCCDVVFTTLTPRVLVDVPKENREFAEGPDRMYRQPDHVGERARMLELVRKVRDA
jgi:hypothetical protein